LGESPGVGGRFSLVDGFTACTYFTVHVNRRSEQRFFFQRAVYAQNRQL